MHNFVIVSNRLPVSVSRVDGVLEFSVSSGGLATAMSSLDAEDQMWVGWPGIASDDLTAAEKTQITKELRKYNCYPVHLTSEQIALFYEGYSNDTLWPLFHYFQSYSQYNPEYWHAYKAVNKKFMSAVKRVAQDEAMIWIQDYQLMLLPTLVRETLPDTKIGFFLHIPFPSYEIFRFLPERKEVLQGLMGADLLGFHVYDYARHFINSCNRILGTSNEQNILQYRGRQITIDAFPIGIDYAKFRKTLAEKETRKEIDSLNERYGNQKILLSVDRLDYSKGIQKRLEAYELFLKEYPSYQKKIVMIMVAVPSRTEVETYKNLRDEIEQTVSRINGMYGSKDWAPISYQFQNLPFNEIVALFSRSDVALVTPIRDGMNLVAKEYLASKRNQKGVLILSEMAGAADELAEALQVNPNDTPMIAKCIHQALTMPKTEQVQRLRAMQGRIRDYSVQKWGADFIEQLDIARKQHVGILNKRLKPSGREQLVQTYASAKKRLILLDYDGTLKGFTNDISAAASKPTIRLRQQLETIAKQPNTTLCIISGRPRKTLDAWFALAPHVTLVAEHGAWVKQNGKWTSSIEAFDKSEILHVLKSYALRTAGAMVEEKDYAVVWHYRRVTPELAYLRNGAIKHDLHKVIEGTDLGVFTGNKIIEVKPTSVDKGVMAKRLYDDHKPDFVFCAGDDYTDEHMFEALPTGAHTVKVGLGSTHAKYQVGKHERILELIEAFSKQ
jgi:trehalose 6-phosphate synthase/phosphatase